MPWSLARLECSQSAASQFAIPSWSLPIRKQQARPRYQYVLHGRCRNQKQNNRKTSVLRISIETFSTLWAVATCLNDTYHWKQSAFSNCELESSSALNIWAGFPFFGFASIHISFAKSSSLHQIMPTELSTSRVCGWCHLNRGNGQC